MWSFKVFQDLGFITAIKDFHNRLPSAGFLYLFQSCYFEIDTQHCHFLINYEMGFLLISMLVLLREILLNCL